MVSPLNALGSAFSDGLNAVGSALNSLGSSIGGFFTNLGSGIHDNFVNFFDGVKDNVSNIFGDVGNILDYLNPFSKNFFLWLALVPSSDWWDHYSSNFDGLVRTKLGFFYEVHDAVNALATSFVSKTLTWPGIQIDLSRYGAGKVDVVDPTAIQQYGEKIRFWIGGLMYFLCGAWLLRKVSGILGAGKGGE